MTRINLNVDPAHLCDQQLHAEIRELPRTVALFSNRVSTRGVAAFEGVTPRPTLGKGHVLFFLPYGKYLAERHGSLVREAKFRGLTCNLPVVKAEDYPEVCRNHLPSGVAGAAWTAEIRERIAIRVEEMKRVPKWTNRVRPDWC